MHEILKCVQIVGESWDQVTCFWTIEEGKRKVDKMVEKFLPEFKDKTLNKVTYTVTVTKKEKALNCKNYY